MSSHSAPAKSGSPAFWQTPGFVILCGCLIALIAFGPRSVMGLFIEPLSTQRGWGRDVFALAIAFQNVIWGAGGPIAGALADRYGPGPVLAGGGLLYAAGLVLMPFAESQIILHLSAGALIGLGLA